MAKAIRNFREVFALGEASGKAPQTEVLFA
jgi:hypothetical protein